MTGGRVIVSVSGGRVTGGRVTGERVSGGGGRVTGERVSGGGGRVTGVRVIGGRDFGGMTKQFEGDTVTVVVSKMGTVIGGNTTTDMLVTVTAAPVCVIVLVVVAPAPVSVTVLTVFGQVLGAAIEPVAVTNDRVMPAQEQALA